MLLEGVVQLVEPDAIAEGVVWHHHSKFVNEEVDLLPHVPSLLPVLNFSTYKGVSSDLAHWQAVSSVVRAAEF